jgi:hypothetical protein
MASTDRFNLKNRGGAQLALTLALSTPYPFSAA